MLESWIKRGQVSIRMASVLASVLASALGSVGVALGRISGISGYGSGAARGHICPSQPQPT